MTTASRKAWLLTIAITFLVAALLYFSFAWFDAATEISDARQEQKYQREREETLRYLLLLIASHLKRREIVQLLRSGPDSHYVINEQPDRVIVDGIVLKFKGDVLTRVISL